MSDGESIAMDVKLAAAVAGAVPRGQVRAFCGVQGISRQTFYKYRKLYRRHGLAGLSERSRRPLRSPTQTDPAIEDRIVRLRKQLAEEGLNNGPWTIRCLLERDPDLSGPLPAESTIYRILQRRGLVTANLKKRPRSSWQRFVWERPNDCWQIDATHYRLANNTVVEIINIIDDHSRVLVGSLAVPACTSSLAWSAITTAFATWAIPARVLSDNGLAFSAHRHGKRPVTFQANLAHLGVQTITSTPYHPQTCGKVERFHHTLKQWLDARPQPLTNLRQLQAAIDTFSAYYNHHRPHRALNRHTPADTWQATPRALPGHRPATTTITTQTLTVDHDGKARGQRYWWGLGRAHHGHTITIIHDNTNATIFHHDTLIATATINPTHRYQRLTHHPPQ